MSDPLTVPMSNQRPVIDGVGPVSQDPGWVPDTLVRPLGLLAAGPVVSDAAVQRVLNVLRPLIGLGCSGGGNIIHRWYNANVDNLGAWCWAWCAATVSYAVSHGGADNLLRDRAYVPYMTQDAQARVGGTEWVKGSAGMRAGDIVIFDWDGAASTNVWSYDHVGICEYDLSGGTWTVLEGNTGNGVMARVKRDARYIAGFIRLDWAKANGVIPAPKTSWKLGDVGAKVEEIQRAVGLTGKEVDGDWGPNTDKAVKAWQTRNGLQPNGIWTAECDAIVKRLATPTPAPTPTQGASMTLEEQIASNTQRAADALTPGQEGVKFDGIIVTLLREQTAILTKIHDLLKDAAAGVLK